MSETELKNDTRSMIFVCLLLILLAIVSSMLSGPSFLEGLSIGVSVMTIISTIWRYRALSRPLNATKIKGLFECVVYQKEGDNYWCDAYPLLDDGPKEHWEVPIPGPDWREGQVFYVMIPQAVYEKLEEECVITQELN